MSQKLDNMEIGYLYFDAKDYLFIQKRFPELYNLFEQYVDRRSNEIRLAVTDKSCDYLVNKVLLVITESAAYTPDGNPTDDAVKLETIWDKA